MPKRVLSTSGSVGSAPVTTLVEAYRGPRSEGRRPYFSGTRLAWMSSGASGTKIRCAYVL